MKVNVPNLTATHDIFTASKDLIISRWVSYDSPQKF